jgi:hypothetical protein
MSAAQILRAARERITVPKRWTQKAMARDADGKPLYWWNGPHAACWCPSAAMLLLDPYDHHSFSTAVRLFRQAIGGANIGLWNDAPGRTHAEVLDAFDRAIALAEAER